MQLTRVADARVVVKVGDTPADIESGQAAACGYVVGVSYGTHSRAELERLRPDVVIDRLSDLIPLVVSNALTAGPFGARLRQRPFQSRRVRPPLASDPATP